MTVPLARVGAIIIDCHDPDALVTFWSEITGVEVAERYPQFIFCTEIPGSSIRLAFQLVPEDKVTKNRLHLDLVHEDPKTLIVRVEELGGSRVDDHQIGDFAWTIMADPEGNEFCIAPAH